MKPKKYEEAILNIINASSDHLTAEEIYLLLKKEEPKVVMASVYNNLKSLYEEDRIRKVVVQGQPDHYDKLLRHDHLVCKDCGALSDMTFQNLTSSLESQLGEAILGYDLQVIYRCPTCRKKSLSL